MSNHKAAYDAVYAYIDKIGIALPSDAARRNAMIWRAVQVALEADEQAALRRAHDAFHLGLRLTEEPNGTFHPSFWETPEVHLHHMDTYVGGNTSTSELAQQVVDAVNAVARIRELHKPERITADIVECSHCYGPYAGDTLPWPCPTIRAIDGSDDE